MTFLYEYLMFLGQVVTLVIGFIVVASFLASLGNRAQSGRQGHLQVQKLNEQIRDLRFAMESRLMTSDQAKKLHKSELKAEKAEQKKQPKDAPKAKFGRNPPTRQSRNREKVARDLRPKRL